MRSKRIPAEEQYRLIMECRQSGLTDHQWYVEHDIKPGPSAWICTTSYLPNALQSAAKKEELTAASPPDVKIGTKKFSKKAKK